MKTLTDMRTIDDGDDDDTVVGNDCPLFLCCTTGVSQLSFFFFSTLVCCTLSPFSLLPPTSSSSDPVHLLAHLSIKRPRRHKKNRRPNFSHSLKLTETKNSRLISFSFSPPQRFFFSFPFLSFLLLLLLSPAIQDKLRSLGCQKDF